MNVHANLGAYRNAVSNFDLAVSNLHRAHGDVLSKANALGVPVFDKEMSAKLDQVVPATTLGLAAHYTNTVVPAVKGN